MVIDASVLAFLFDSQTAAPGGPNGQPVSDCQARVEHLIAELQQAKATLIIPSPALSEILVYAGSAAPDWLAALAGVRCCKIAPFDTLAAIECADLARERMIHGATADVIRRKAKFDEQIVAIALVERADEILSDDKDIRRLVGAKFPVRGIADLPLPPRPGHLPLFGDDPV